MDAIISYIISWCIATCLSQHSHFYDTYFLDIFLNCQIYEIIEHNRFYSFSPKLFVQFHGYAMTQHTRAFLHFIYIVLIL